MTKSKRREAERNGAPGRPERRHRRWCHCGGPRRHTVHRGARVLGRVFFAVEACASSRRTPSSRCRRLPPRRRAEPSLELDDETGVDRDQDDFPSRRRSAANPLRRAAPPSRPAAAETAGSISCVCRSAVRDSERADARRGPVRRSPSEKIARQWRNDRHDAWRLRAARLALSEQDHPLANEPYASLSAADLGDGRRRRGDAVSRCAPMCDSRRRRGRTVEANLARG